MELQCNNVTYTSHIASRVQFHFVARLGRSVFASAWLVVVGLCQRHWWHSGRRDNWQVMGWGVDLKKNIDVWYFDDVWGFWKLWYIQPVCLFCFLDASKWSISTSYDSREAVAGKAPQNLFMIIQFALISWFRHIQTMWMDKVGEESCTFCPIVMPVILNTEPVLVWHSSKISLSLGRQ